MFKVDFYESGKGETTILTFPDESIGVLDAYPSDKQSRPDITSLVSNKKIRFICMSHPHDDHVNDLSAIFDSNHPEQFWHTIQATDRFFYGLPEYDTFNSPLKDFVERKKREATESLINLFSRAKDKQVSQMIVSSNTKEMCIAGVNIYFLAPDIKTISQWGYKFQGWVSDERKTMPDFNILSTIIAFQYGENVFVHGGDALTTAWKRAYDVFSSYELKLASLMKIPHHGAKNALFIGNKRPRTSYMRFFIPSAHLICFGNATHPDREVWQCLYRKSRNTYFLLNRYRPNTSRNPLNIPGGRSIDGDDLICNSHVHAEWAYTGPISISGANCQTCGKCKQLLVS